MRNRPQIRAPVNIRHKYQKYLEKYNFLMYGGVRLTTEQGQYIMTFLTRIYRSREFRREYSVKPSLPMDNHSSLGTNSGTASDTASDTAGDTDSETDDESCQECSTTHYCHGCVDTSVCGCRMTALFFYLGFRYLIQHLDPPMTIPKLAQINKLDLIRYILVERLNYYQNSIMSGLIDRKQQEKYQNLDPNHLREGANIVGIFQKFPRDPTAHAFHFLFVLKIGPDLIIRQSWYDGGASKIKYSYDQLEGIVDLARCQEIVTQSSVTKSQLLEVYGSFLSADNFTDQLNIFPIYVLNSHNDSF